MMHLAFGADTLAQDWTATINGDHGSLVQLDIEVVQGLNAAIRVLEVFTPHPGVLRDAQITEVANSDQGAHFLTLQVQAGERARIVCAKLAVMPHVKSMRLPSLDRSTAA